MRLINARRIDSTLGRAVNAVAVALIVGLAAVIMTLIGGCGS